MVLVAILALWLAPAPLAGAPDQPAGQAMVLAVDPAPLVTQTPAGPVRFSVEIADEPAERSAGLMFREAMADDHGMLFVFQRPQIGSFWMKNTVLPLDIVFIRGDGTVDSIGRGVPLSLEPVRSKGIISFVLELNAGIAEKAGIVPGTLLSHPVIGKGH